MTRDEARKLMGGYATGSLTEAERGALFSAALEDQELFDELAGEHSLRELINSPGVRNRLLAALAPAVEEQPRRVWWRWAALACGIAAGTVWILVPRTVETPVQVAETVTVARSEPAAAIEPTIPPTVEKAAKLRASAPKPDTQMLAPAAPVVATPAPAVAPPAEQTQLKTESAELSRPAAQPRADQSSAGRFAKGGGATGTPRNAFVASQAGAATFSPLTYEFTTDRKLRITPTQPGILQVTMGTQILFARNAVAERTPIELAVPEGAVSVRIEFASGNGTPFVVIPSVPQ